MMAPCVLCIGAPLVILAAKVMAENREFERLNPGSSSSFSFGSISVNGDSTIAYVFAGSVFVLFIAGFWLMLGSLNSKSDSEA